MYLDRFFKSQFGRNLMSIILGLGLASLFRRACHDRKCYRFVSPDINEINENIYKFNNKCYTYKPNATTCLKEKKQINI